MASELTPSCSNSNSISYPQPVPGSETVSIPKRECWLGKISELISNATSIWFELGGALWISIDDRNITKEDKSDASQRLINTIERWLKTLDEDCDYIDALTILRDALSNKTVGRNDIAHTVNKEISKVQDRRVTKRMSRVPEIDINPDRNKWHQLFLESLIDVMGESTEIGTELHLPYKEIKDKCTGTHLNKLTQVLALWLKSANCPENDYLEALTQIYGALKSLSLNTAALKIGEKITALTKLQDDSTAPKAKRSKILGHP